MFRSALKPPRGEVFGENELGLNASCRSLSGYSPDDGDDKSLNKGVCPCPSWKVAREYSDRLVGDDTLPWLPQTPGSEAGCH
jgi:hypothetical protein